MTPANPPSSPAAPPTVQRQISLPMAKAVEIAYKSIRQRLSRSLLVTSGIVLALAFLMAINTSEALVNSMREWINPRPGTPLAENLRQQRSRLEARQAELEQALRVRRDQIQVATETPPTLGGEQKPVDPVAVFGADAAELKKELGSLPGVEAHLFTAAAADPAVLTALKEWVALQRESRGIKEQLTAPQRLQALMNENGVPTEAGEVAASRVQTRWLLALALLVAFVGILNSMLMSVTERFREIGTMKCLGALDSFIVKLFLIESLFQGTIGTVLGILIGLGLSIMAAAIGYGEFAWKNFPMAGILTAAGYCLLVGVALTVGGAVYPAWQAARMHPIEAMRVEA